MWSTQSTKGMSAEGGLFLPSLLWGTALLVWIVSCDISPCLTTFWSHQCYSDGPGKTPVCSSLWRFQLGLGRRTHGGDLIRIHSFLYLLYFLLSVSICPDLQGPLYLTCHNDHVMMIDLPPHALPGYYVSWYFYMTMTGGELSLMLTISY